MGVKAVLRIAYSIQKGASLAMKTGRPVFVHLLYFFAAGQCFRLRLCLLELDGGGNGNGEQRLRRRHWSSGNRQL